MVLLVTTTQQHGYFVHGQPSNAPDPTALEARSTPIPSRNVSASAENFRKQDALAVLFLHNGPVGIAGSNYAYFMGVRYVQAIFRENIDAHFVRADTGVGMANMLVKELVRREVEESQVRLVVGLDLSYQSPLNELAPELKNVFFLNIDGHRTQKRLSTAAVRMYEAQYLAGLLGGMFTRTKHVCLVAPFPIPNSYRLINAFMLGANEVDPEVKVSMFWTGNADCMLFWARARLVVLLLLFGRREGRSGYHG